jgi:hypothetical protein
MFEEKFSGDVSKKSGYLSELAFDLISMSVCDSEGNKLFEQEDIELLKKKDSEAIKNIFSKCMEINGIGSDSVSKDKKKSLPTK